MEKKNLSDFEFARQVDYEEVESLEKDPSFLEDVLTRFQKKKGAKLSFILILVILGLAIVVPILSSSSYTEQVNHPASST